MTTRTLDLDNLTSSPEATTPTTGNACCVMEAVAFLAGEVV